MNLKMKLSLLVILLFNVAVIAQKRYDLTGKVTAESDSFPIPGVNINIINGQGGVATDFDGEYLISVKKGDEIQFSYLGFDAQSVIITDQKTINIVLREEANQLDQVVIQGYGTIKKSHLTGSISKVKNTALDQIPIARVDDALIGQVAGVNIQQTNPEAGGAPSIKIRGQGSISASSSPLIVVDGIPVGNDSDYLSSIDMNDIESVEVLKDAASTAIFGSRGANGVIMITTKRGKEGPPKFKYNTFTGYKFVERTDILTTPSEWAAYEAANNNGVLSDKMKYIQKLGTYTDWEKVMFNGGIITDHNLSVSGGTQNTKYRTSLGYNSDDGVMLTDNFKKLNFRLNLDTKINKAELGVSINPSFTKQRRFPINVIDAIRQNSWLPIYLDENSIQYVNRFRENGRWADAKIGDYAMERMFDDYDLDNGTPNPNSTGTDISNTSNQNAYAKVNELKEMRYQTKLFGSAYFKYNFNKNFNFKQTIGGDYKFTRREEYRGVEATRNEESDSYSQYRSSYDVHTVAESLLSYNKDFGKHSISAVAAFSAERWSYNDVSLDAAGYNDDYIQTIPAANLTGGSTIKAEAALVSYLTRINYAYDDRYLVALSFRTDGSSRFGKEKQFAQFPAVALGWRLSNEKFLQSSTVIKNLKLRASYGLSGTTSNLGPYDYIPTVSPVGTGLSGVASGYNPDNLGNPALSWEQLKEFNGGIDADFFGGKFGLSFDYYVRTSSDLLLEVPVSAITGFQTFTDNRGIVENKGFELELHSTNIRNNNFKWTSSALFTVNKNKLVDFADSNGLISIIDDKRPSEWVAQVGQPVSSFYGYVVDKEIPLEYINNPYFPINGRSQDIYVKDINGDGIIDTDDRTNLGNPYPKLVWSFSNEFKYKNIDFSFMFQGSYGAKVRNINAQYLDNQLSSNQDSTADLPNADFTVQRIFTSDIVQDASYISLRNVNLGYTFSKDLVHQFGMDKLRLYFAGSNLLYLMSNDYKGYNPEGITDGSDNPLTYGYQKGAAPIYKTISFGLNVQF